MNNIAFKSRLALILQGGRVSRFHTTPIRAQSVAEHSWGVAMILALIYPVCTKAAIMAALAHDLGEAVTGDVPAPTKWGDPVLRARLEAIEHAQLTEAGLDYKLSPFEARVLKIADMLDLLCYCSQQLMCGNTFGAEVYRNGYKWLNVKLNDAQNGTDQERAWELVVYHARRLIDTLERSMTQAGVTFKESQS